MSFPKRFDTAREAEIYKQSVEAGYFKPEYMQKAENSPKQPGWTKKGKKAQIENLPAGRQGWELFIENWNDTFVCPTPPPNVSGVLHIGHALGLSIQDAVCRYWRMKGKKVLWIPGTDHAGITTQVQVEKKLKKEQDLTRHDIGRVEFLKKMREFATQHRHIILDQFKKLGASLDWDREQFTLSERLSRAVRKSFKNLSDQGKIYQGYRIANRCSRCQTVLSDAEVELVPSKSKLYQIRYFLIGWKNIHIDVFTTRPETIPADVALAVHPQDKRYKQFVGKEVMVPFVNRKIPVITDDTVDMSFGSWVLKITPTHDQTDFDIGTKHNLPLDVFAIDKFGKWSTMLPEFGGMEVEKFFDTYLERLKEIGNLIGIEDYENSTPHCERCATKIEPLASEQWFVDVKEYADSALSAIDNGEIKLYPERSGNQFHQYLDKVRPWCISRQLWWGHRVPVRQNDNGDVVVADEDFIFQKAREAKKEDSAILSLIIFNCIADNKLEEKFEFQDAIEVLLKPCLVKQDGLLYQLYLDIYEGKFAWEKKIVSQIQKLRKLLDELEAWPDEDALDKLLTMMKGSFGLKQERQFIVRDWEMVTGYKKLKHHTDVLDTWFSSGLRAFSTLGWPDKTDDLENYFPMSFVDTGADILFPWIARMIMMSYANLNSLPFSNVYFHGLVRDEKGAKMSKSKGNGIDPLTMIDKYGADALRISMLANNPAGNDLNYSEAKTEYYGRFITKLWNASRYVWLNTVGFDADREENKGREEVHVEIDLSILTDYIKENQATLNDFDRWILNGLDELIAQSDKLFAIYTFTQSLEDLVKFIRNNFCDWYIEIAKIQKNDLTDKILLYCIGTILKLLHPFAPFVTQAIWHDMGFVGEALCVSDYPKMLTIWSMNTQTKLFIELISEFRNLKAESWIKPNEKISALIKANTNIATMVKQYEAMFCKIVTCDNLNIISITQDVPAEYTTKLVFDITIWIKTEKPVDTKSLIADLEKQLVVENQFIGDLQSLLNSEWFMNSAPKEIKEAKQTKLNEVKSKVKQIEVEIQRLKYMGS